MNKVTLRQLRYFQALAQHGHFGHAAEVCAISQPAMSVQIRELEENLGVTLFERSARKVRLTPFGDELAVRVRDILSAVDELGELARATAGQVPDRLRIGIIPTIAPYLLPAMVKALTGLNPALDLHVRETQTAGLREELENGRLDAAVVALPISQPAFTEVELFEEDFVLVRPEADAGKPVPDGDALRRMRLLLLEEGHCFRDQALSFCAAPTSVPRDGLDGSSLTTLVQMVGAGIGVTLIPEMAIALETRSAPVVVSRFADPVPRRMIGLIWRRKNPLAKQLQGIADVLRDAAKS